MGSRVTINGRVVHERDIKRLPRVEAELDENGEQVFFTPIKPEDLPQPQPLAHGKLWEHPEFRLRYRVVDRAVLRMDQGWAGIKWWMHELRCTEPVFVRLCRASLFDCARSPDGHLRYRCLDYSKAMDAVRQHSGSRFMKGRSERR